MIPAHRSEVVLFPKECFFRYIEMPLKKVASPRWHISIRMTTFCVEWWFISGEIAYQQQLFDTITRRISADMSGAISENGLSWSLPD